ncbi:hypothetical protein MTP16_16940 [Hymenobacter monticola]|uniref:Uncharacterized protein n=1 Tax=Hymenobacter monticola TaxID=1705399 RepID=A0ABY4B110_9BACT|nr:hypothetical protein [Hymenobacter monticola]UOE32809.1 hypothetical protein MTP16_16940 [Hymenobacter monticola]
MYTPQAADLSYPLKGGGTYCPAENGFTDPTGLFEGVLPSREGDINTQNLFFTNPETKQVIKLKGDDETGQMMYTLIEGDE